jgi:hypothetical protein
MAQISVEIIRLPGSLLRGNLQVKASLRTQRARYGTACLQSDSLWNNFILYPLGL